MKNGYLLTVFALSICGYAAAQTPDSAITYKGLNLGVAQAEFSARFPDYKCGPSTCNYVADDCTGSLRMGESSDDRAAKIRGCTERNSIGGAYVRSATAYFRDGKLSRISFLTTTAHAETLIKAATERYGAPKVVNEEPFRTKGGGVFPNLRATWEIEGNQLYAARNAASLGTGWAQLATLDELQRLAEEHKAGVKKSATDF